jgi:hypothetical protein
MVMPNELTHLVHHVVNHVACCRSIHLGFEPLPEPLNRIVLRRIGCQVFEDDPVMLSEKALDGTALVHRGIIQHQDQQCLGKPLLQLMEQLQKHLGCAAGCPLPIAVLCAEMQRTKHRGPVTRGWGRDFDLMALAKPPTLDIGFIGTMRRIDKQDFFRLLTLADTDGRDDCCHPGFFFRGAQGIAGYRLSKAFVDGSLRRFLHPQSYSRQADRSAYR